MLLGLLIGLAVGAALALAIYIIINKMRLKGKKEQILVEAEREGEAIKKEKIFQAKEKFLQLKSEHEQFVNNKNAQLREAENRISQKENSINQKEAELSRRLNDAENAKRSLNAQRESYERKTEDLNKLTAQVNKQLETVAGMTSEEAKSMLVENMKAEARTAAQAYINDTMDEARLNAAKEAKRIVINTIQRTATETVIENAVTTFPIDRSRDASSAVRAATSAPSRLRPVSKSSLMTRRTPSCFPPLTRSAARWPVWPCTSWSWTAASIPPASRKWSRRSASSWTTRSSRPASGPASTLASMA